MGATALHRQSPNQHISAEEQLTHQEEVRNKSNIKADMRMVEVTVEEETVS